MKTITKNINNLFLHKSYANKPISFYANNYQEKIKLKSTPSQDSFILNTNEKIDLSSINLNEFNSLISTLNSTKNSSFSDINLSDMTNNYNNYDFPLKLALSARNDTLKGSPYLCKEIPPMFNDIDPKKLFQEFDLLSKNLREGNLYETSSIKIEDKNFKITYISSGLSGATFKIEDSKNQSCAYKVYFNPVNKWFKNLTEIKLSYETSKAEVNNVPDFYFANPNFEKVSSSKKRKPTALGDWKVVEYIDENSKKKTSNINFETWLEQNKLNWEDKHSKNEINGFVVDLGEIYPSYNFNETFELNSKIKDLLINNPDWDSQKLLQNLLTNNFSK